MNIEDFKAGLRSWHFTRGRAIDLTVTLTATGIYEFFARPIYRPYIYSQGINDFHIADTLGNSLGSFATIFFFLFVFGGEKKRDTFLINTVIASLVVYELAHPLLGKPMDWWDVAATLTSGGLSHVIYKAISR